MRSVHFGCFILSVAGVIANLGCNKATPAANKPKPPAAVVAGKPIILPIVEWDEFVGRLAPIESVQVRSRVSGYLASTNFEEGQLVRAGDVIAVIDQRPFLAEVNRNKANLTAAEALLVQAKAAVAQAKSEKIRADVRQTLTKKQLDRNVILRKQDATALQDLEISEAEFEQAKAEVDVSISKVESAESTIVAAQAAVSIAQSNLDLATLNLQYTEIRAPIDGRISNRLVTEGNLVSGGTNDSTLLTTIVSLNPIHCYFDADEQTYLKYLQLAREGKRKTSREVRNPVFMALANDHAGFPHQGHMDFVENRLDEQTGTIRGRAIFSNESLELTPGLFARIRLPGSPRYDAILIPDKAVGTDQAEKFVLTVDKDNKIVRKLVTLGPVSHGLRIIRDGLKGDERVVLSGQQKARPGAEVVVTWEDVQQSKEVLPDEYEPVPQDKWLTPKRIAAGNVNIPTNESEPAGTSPSGDRSTDSESPSPNANIPTLGTQP